MVEVEGATPIQIEVEVCHAQPGRVFLRSVCLPQGSTVGEAIRASGLLEAEPGIDLQVHRVGVFGKLKSLDAELRAGDRVEIYRGLIADPKEARRRRAAHKVRSERTA